MTVIERIVGTAEHRSGDDACRRLTARRAAAIMKAAALDSDLRKQNRSESERHAER